jgi:hypothetical protein
MEMPNVVSVAMDSIKNIRYEVYAYRELDAQELRQTVFTYLQMAKRKPKRNTCIQIHTVIGVRD